MRIVSEDLQEIFEEIQECLSVVPNNEDGFDPDTMWEFNHVFNYNPDAADQGGGNDAQEYSDQIVGDIAWSVWRWWSTEHSAECCWRMED